MAQGYSLHPDGTLAEHTVTNTRAYTEINGLDDGRIMFAIVSFEGVLNFTAEGRLYYRIGAHLLDVDGTLPRSISTPYRDRLSGGRLRRLDTVDAAARDCYTWHLQQCIWLDYICNCFLIVMRPVGRARRDPRFSNERPAPPGVHRGKQRPTAPALRARVARIWPGTLSALARSPHH